MHKPYQQPRIGNRRWIAWKLVQLAERIYDAEFYDRIRVVNNYGVTEWEAVVVGDLYGRGISSTRGHDEINHYRILWEHDYKPEWLED